MLSRNLRSQVVSECHLVVCFCCCSRCRCFCCSESQFNALWKANYAKLNKYNWIKLKRYVCLRLAPSSRCFSFQQQISYQHELGLVLVLVSVSVSALLLLCRFLHPIPMRNITLKPLMLKPYFRNEHMWTQRSTRASNKSWQQLAEEYYASIFHIDPAYLLTIGLRRLILHSADFLKFITLTFIIRQMMIHNIMRVPRTAASIQRQSLRIFQIFLNFKSQ